MNFENLTFMDGVQLFYDLMRDLTAMNNKIPAGKLHGVLGDIFCSIQDDYEYDRLEALREYFKIDQKSSCHWLRKEIAKEKLEVTTQ